MNPETEKFRMEHAGMLARSAQGHAAKGMKIKDQEDMWVSIQHNTFRNWVNVQLRDTGLRVENLSEDMRDGLALVTLVETLQQRKLRKVKRVLNQHQALENVTNALNAIADDGIKLVNIGNVDIVNGNLKLILGLIWSLIMHYQIGQTKFPPKKLMLSWLKAVLPGCSVANFTSDWNSGVNLSALVDYCRPGLFRSWKTLNPDNSVENCKRAMEIAHREFNIPMVLEPEYLASPYLDDLSGMTYLSYFMKEGGPGYKATLDWVKKQLPEKNIKNMTTDWNDGHNLSTLIKKLGGPVPGYKNMPRNSSHWESNLQVAIDGGKKLGVNPVLSAADMARPDVEHLGPMAYLAYFQWVRPRKSATEAIHVRCDVENVRVNNPVPFRIDFLSKDVVVSELRVEVRGPSGPVRVDIDSGPRGAKGSFLPKEVGFYELEVLNEGESVDGSPIKIRALPDVSKIMFSGIDPCALGSIVEVLINSNGAGGGDIDVIALSPTRRSLLCPVKNEDGVYTATFQPDEAGEWSIAVTYDDEHIQGSPFTCHVYDPNAVKVHDLDIGSRSSPGKPFTFLVDAAACGWGDAKIDVTFDGKSVPSKSLEVDQSLYEVTFTPFEAGKYKIYVYFNGHETKGSPFALYLGVEKPPERKGSKSKKKKSSRIKETDIKPIVKEYTSVVDSPMHNNSMNNSHNLFNKTFDSSLSRSYDKHSTLNKSYESTLDEINSPSSKNYLSSLNKTKTSTLNKSSDSLLNRSSENIISRNYSSSTLDRSIHRDSAQKKLSFDLPKTTTLDLKPSRIDKIYSSSSLQRNSSSNLNSSVHKESSFNSTHNSSFNTNLDSTFNSSSSTVLNASRGHKFSDSTYDKYSSRINTSSSNIRYSPDGIRSPHSPGTLSPKESPRHSPMRQMSPRESPLRQMSPRESPLRQLSPSVTMPDNELGLSSPAKVLLATQNAKKSEGTSFYYSSVANMKILPSTY